MKALLKDGQEWVDIDTSYLFRDQYNTSDGRRIFDKDISAIRDDARRNMGKCRYCGALIKRGEEEKHFAERESKGCTGCFWHMERTVDSKTSTETNATIDENGERATVKTKTTIETIKRVCTYSESCCANCECDCTLKECRRLGVSWFTPENTFFLKYPHGLDDITDFDRLQLNGFRRDDALINMHYYKKIGTYSLEACVTYQDGKPSGVYAFRLWNCRKDYIFRCENGAFLTYKYGFGFSQEKTLKGIPADVISAVKKICEYSATAAPGGVSV